MRIPFTSAVLIALSFCLGCRTPGDPEAIPYSAHPKAVVRGASSTGAVVVGGTVGVPLTIALIPITGPVVWATEEHPLFILVPFTGSAIAGGAVFGTLVLPIAPLFPSSEPKVSE